MPHKTEVIQGQGWNWDYMDAIGCVQCSPSPSMKSVKKLTAPHCASNNRYHPFPTEIFMTNLKTNVVVE